MSAADPSIAASAGFPSRRVWARLLDAVEARDVVALCACFTTDGLWQNVPHDAWVGRETIAAMLGPILRRSSRVHWDMVTAAYEPHRAWLERIDRFWIDDVEYAVRANGVIEVDPDSGLITALRDYSDLGEWRSRLAQAGPIWDS